MNKQATLIKVKFKKDFPNVIPDSEIEGGIPYKIKQNEEVWAKECNKCKKYHLRDLNNFYWFAKSLTFEEFNEYCEKLNENAT